MNRWIGTLVHAYADREIGLIQVWSCLWIREIGLIQVWSCLWIK